MGVSYKHLLDSLSLRKNQQMLLKKIYFCSEFSSKEGKDGGGIFLKFTSFSSKMWRGG